MANFAKYAAGAAGHLMAHYERGKDEYGEYIRFGNQSIVPERTPENYNLAPHRAEGQLAYLQKRLSEVKVQKRADVNVMGSWVVTLPQGDYTREQERDFFDACYRFLADKYGEQNVISAYVHRDENQPHLHFAFIPVVPDTKWNAKHPDKPREKVSAKECVTKQDLDQFHPQLQAFLDRELDEEIFYPVLNGATAGGNRTIAEMRAEIATEVYDQTAEELTQKTNEMYWEQADLQRKIEYARCGLNDLQKDLQEAARGLQEGREQLTAIKNEQEHLSAQNAALKAEEAAMRAENTALRAQIVEARNELSAVQRVLMAAKEKAASVFGTKAAYDRAIAEARAETAKERKMALIERFLEIPAVKALWESYCKVRGIDPVSIEPSRSGLGAGRER